MDALLICGGRGTRLDATVEKPLLPIGGEPMVDRIRRALTESAIETVYAVTSPNAAQTHRHLAETDCAVVETPGEGYVADLGTALADERIELPVCTVAADLPLLDADVVDRVFAAYAERADEAGFDPTEAGRRSQAPSMTVCVPVSTKRRLGCSIDSRLPSDDTLAPTGCNVVGHPDQLELIHVVDDTRLAINVNRLQDAQLAEALCA